MSATEIRALLAASPPVAETRIATIRKWVGTLSDDAIDAMGGQKAVEAEALALYDTYVVPLDIPGIPALAEPLVDRYIKRIISALIWAVDDDGETR